MEAFREHDGGFWYGYHVDSHTSLVGVRESAREHLCFESDAHVEEWLGERSADAGGEGVRLFAYPAQSNMNGRRLPLRWCSHLRSSRQAYTLLDAAAYVSTSALDLSDATTAPDFTALSLYKIFGFPDLGALIVRKDTAHLFQKRRYFGGGTVDMVVCLKEQWHAKKSGPLHEQLEDGTLPIHSIIALKSAMQTHREIFGTLDRLAKHTTALAQQQLCDGLSALRHANDRSVCIIYSDGQMGYSDATRQGPIVAFNLKDSRGQWVSNTELEKLAAIRNVHFRTGGVCNPGGVAQSLSLAPWEMRESFSAGHRCGGENDILNGKPTGINRVSLGAMSTKSDVVRFLAFVDEFFADKTLPLPPPASALSSTASLRSQQLHVESLTVYPVKSCAGWQVPPNTSWEIRAEGLAWDREWCIVHQGTGKALSQKQHPRMALIRPVLDFNTGVLQISAPGTTEQITVPLSKDPSCFNSASFAQRDATVCGDPISAHLYTSPAVAEYLTAAIGVPCTLARFPAASGASPSARHSKAHLSRAHATEAAPRPILLSNESPILTISRASLNRLNEQIKATGGKAAHPTVFRANIVLASSPLLPPGHEQPWAEDDWESVCIGGDHG
ncbi:hypothetical protein LTR53_017832, partial [Teratosphaeriaceae sp. CCFEE 6253]